jgi:hypothetical protein
MIAAPATRQGKKAAEANVFWLCSIACRFLQPIPLAELWKRVIAQTIISGGKSRPVLD